MFNLDEYRKPFYDLVESVVQVYFKGDHAKTKLWMNIKNPTLGGITPLESKPKALSNFVGGSLIRAFDEHERYIDLLNEKCELEASLIKVKEENRGLVKDNVMLEKKYQASLGLQACSNCGGTRTDEGMPCMECC